MAPNLHVTGAGTHHERVEWGCFFLSCWLPSGGGDEGFQVPFLKIEILILIHCAGNHSQDNQNKARDLFVSGVFLNIILSQQQGTRLGQNR